jgi:hypothetical protein
VPTAPVISVLIALSVLGGCETPGVCDGKHLALTISGNHGHEERIEKKALAKGPGVYKFQGDSHEHGFRLSETDIGRLKAGESIELRSTSMNAHVHELRVACAK